MPSWLEKKTNGSSSRVKTTFDEQKSSRKGQPKFNGRAASYQKVFCFSKVDTKYNVTLSGKQKG